MVRRIQISADIPLELRDTDDLLHRYGRSVMDRHRKQRCASAEGRYVIPPNDDDREPREVLMAPTDLALVQRALLKVDERERTVLQILYVPQRLPPEAQLRIKRIPASLSASRHLDGLKQFAARYRIEAILLERAQSGLRRVQRRTQIEAALVSEAAQPRPETVTTRGEEG